MAFASPQNAAPPLSPFGFPVTTTYSTQGKLMRLLDAERTSLQGEGVRSVLTGRGGCGGGLLGLVCKPKDMVTVGN